MHLLKRDIPLPNSAPPRTAIRQSDLCSAARVCKLFASIVDDVLYHTIVTDDLSSLLAHVESPSVRQRFALCQKLSIEYCAKGEDATYKMLLGEGGDNWCWMGRTPRELELSKIMNGKLEVERTVFALLDVIGNKLGNLLGEKEPIIFPNVHTLTIAAIYGHPDNFWSVYNNELSGQIVDDFHTATSVFNVFIARLPSIRHMCTRNSDGFYGLAVKKNPKAPVPRCTRTLHINENVDHLEVVPGQHLRIVSDAKPSVNWAAINHQLRQAFNTQANDRVSEQYSYLYGKDVMDVDIYLSTAVESTGPNFGGAMRRISVEEQKKKAEAMGKVAQGYYSDLSRLPDKVRWHISQEAPICEACGTGAPF